MHFAIVEDLKIDQNHLIHLIQENLEKAWGNGVEENVTYMVDLLKEFAEAQEVKIVYFE